MHAFCGPCGLAIEVSLKPAHEAAPHHRSRPQVRAAAEAAARAAAAAPAAPAAAPPPDDDAAGPPSDDALSDDGAAAAGGVAPAAAPLPGLQSAASQAWLARLRCWSSREADDKFRRWRVYEDLGEKVRLWCDDWFPLPKKRVVMIASLPNARWLRTDRRKKPAPTYGKCMVLQKVKKEWLEQRAYLLSEADVTMNSGSISNCCECGADVASDATVFECQGRYPSGGVACCRRGVACSKCGSEESCAYITGKEPLYFCRLCRRAITSSSAYEDVWGFNITPPNRYRRLTTPGTPVLSQLAADAPSPAAAAQARRREREEQRRQLVNEIGARPGPPRALRAFRGGDTRT